MLVVVVVILLHVYFEKFLVSVIVVSWCFDIGFAFLCIMYSCYICFFFPIQKKRKNVNFNQEW